MLASGIQVRGYKPGRSRRIFRAKILVISLPILAFSQWNGCRFFTSIQFLLLHISNNRTDSDLEGLEVKYFRTATVQFAVWVMELSCIKWQHISSSFLLLIIRRIAPQLTEYTLRIYIYIFFIYETHWPYDVCTDCTPDTTERCRPKLLHYSMCCSTRRCWRWIVLFTKCLPCYISVKHTSKTYSKRTLFIHQNTSITRNDHFFSLRRNRTGRPSHVPAHSPWLSQPVFP
jgi:hypothetical protein